MTTFLLNAGVPLISAIIGTGFGGYVVHRAALARDTRNEQRARRVEHLIGAYRRLVTAANRPISLTAEQSAGLESAVDDVMLLGEAEEVEAAQQFLVEYAAGGGAGVDGLLAALRTSLRRELSLDSIPLPDPYNLRITHLASGEEHDSAPAANKVGSQDAPTHE